MMIDVNEQFKHPDPVKHSDNEKSKLPPRDDSPNRPKKNTGEDEPPVE